MHTDIKDSNNASLKTHPKKGETNMLKTMDRNNVIKTGAKRLLSLVYLSLASMSSAFAVDLQGTVETANGTPVCALALASGRSVFTCNSQGSFNLSDLSTESDGTITLQVYADGFYPNITTLSAFNVQQVVMKPAEVCDGGGGSGSGTEPLTNKQQTERLIGDWEMISTIVDTYFDYYRMVGPATKGINGSVNYYLAGLDRFNYNDVFGGYDGNSSVFRILDEGINEGYSFDQYWEFDMSSADILSGCLYFYDRAADDFSRCIVFTGSEFSPSASASANNNALSQVSASALSAQQRKPNEIEALRLARASLKANSVEDPEDTFKRAEAKKRYVKLKEAMQAR